MTREPSPAMKLLRERREQMLGHEHRRIVRLFWASLVIWFVIGVAAFVINSPWPSLASCSLMGLVIVRSKRWERRLRRLNDEIDEQARIDEEERQHQRREGFRTRLREVIRPEDKREG